MDSTARLRRLAPKLGDGHPADISRGIPRRPRSALARIAGDLSAAGIGVVPGQGA